MYGGSEEGGRGGSWDNFAEKVYHEEGGNAKDLEGVGGGLGSDILDRLNSWSKQSSAA